MDRSYGSPDRPEPGPALDRWIRGLRGSKQAVDPFVPHAFFTEPERTTDGRVVDVATIVLVNRECPFTCLMCDLWAHTTDEEVPTNALSTQVRYALGRRSPEARHIKLYNAGSFFDPKAVPPGDLVRIAELLDRFERVVVESHPLLVGAETVRLNRLLDGRLEVAMGLETIHPDVLLKLNKRMRIEDFRRAADLLAAEGIPLRSFVLIQPPFLAAEEGVDWTVRSVEYALDCRADCVVLIPTRSGNGALDQCLERGEFALASGDAIEDATQRSLLLEPIRKGRARVFIDLWELGRFLRCDRCRDARVDRLRRMNLEQRALPPVPCSCRLG